MDTEIIISAIKSIDPAVLTSLVGLIGTAVGGLISYFASRSARKSEWDLEMKEKDLIRKEELFSDFLTEANRLMTKSMTSTVKEGEEFSLIASLESKIWFHSDVLGALARKITVETMIAHSPPRENESRESFPKLKDKFVSECKKILANSRKY